MLPQNNNNASHGNTWSWRKISDLIASANNTTSISYEEKPNQQKICHLKVLDTVFLGRSSSSSPFSASPSVKGSANHTKKTHLDHQVSQNIKLLSWVFTSRKNNGCVFTKRKITKSSNLRHVYDKFCRFALSYPENAKYGARIVCTLYREDHTPLVKWTADQFKREIKRMEDSYQKSNLSSSWRNCNYIQCYLRPYRDIDQIFRAIITFDYEKSHGDEKNIQSSCSSDAITFDLFRLEDAMMMNVNDADVTSDKSTSKIEKISFSSTSPTNSNSDEELHRKVYTELKYVLSQTVRTLEASLINTDKVHKERITTFVADFLLDDNGELWLCKIPKLETKIIPSHHTNKNVTSKTILPLIPQESNLSSSASCSSSRSKTATSLDHVAKQDSLSFSLPSTITMKGVIMNKAEKENIRISISNKDKKTISKASTVSSAEHEFLTRNQIKQPNFSDDTNKRVIIQQLKERIAQLESEIKRGHKITISSAQIADEERVKRQELTKNLSRIRQKYESELNRIKNESSKTILQLESQLNRSKAEITRISQSSNISSSDDDEDDNENRHYDIQELLLKIQSLHQEITQSQHSWGEEKRAILSSHSAIHQKLAAKHRGDLSTEREKLAEMEDKLSSQKESTLRKEKENLVYMKKLNDCEQKKDQLQQIVENLRIEMNVMKQSLEVTEQQYEQELSGDDSFGDHSKPSKKRNREQESLISDLRKEKSELENQLRTLVNKVEFLKAQLQSEATSKEEFQRAIQNLREEKKIMIQDTYKKIQEFQSQHDNEVSQIQKQLQEAREQPIRDKSVLEGKIASLQAQLGDAIQDLTNSRMKEDLTSSNYEREYNRNRKLQKELAEARHLLDKSQNEVLSLKEQESIENANEAVLRRLDNERQYLKNQLQSELYAKQVLEKKLEEVGEKLIKLEESSKTEILSLESKLQKQKDEFEEKETKAKSSNQVLQAEVDVQNNQLSDLKEAYVKVRDQLRIDQGTVEQLRATCQRLSTELKAAQDEISHKKRVSEEAIKRHSENTEAISIGIKKKDIAHRNQVARIQNEMHIALDQAATCQEKMAQMKDEMVYLQKRNLQIQSASNIWAIFIRWQRMRELRAFHTWRNQVTLTQSRQRAERKHVHNLHLIQERLRKEYENNMRETVQKLVSEKRDHIKRLEIASIEKRDKQEEKNKKELNELLAKEREKTDFVLKEKKKEYDQKQVALEKVHQARITRCQEENSRKIQRVRQDKDKELEDLRNSSETRFNEQKEEFLQELNDRWQNILNDKMKDLTSEKDMKVAEVTKSFELRQKELKAKAEDDVQSLRVEYEQTISEEVQKETVRMNKVLAEEIEKLEQVWQNRVKEIEEQWKMKCDQMKESHEKQLATKMTTFETLLEQKQTEWTEKQKQSRSLDIKKAIDEERKSHMKAMKSEANRWEEVVLKKEQKMQIERDEAYKRGYEDRDAKLIVEKQAMQKSANEALEKVKQESKESLRQALDTLKSQIQNVREEAEIQKEEAISITKEKLQEEHKDTLEKLKFEHNGVLQEEKMKLLNEAQKKQETAVNEAISRERSFTQRLEAELNNEIKRRREMESECTSQINQIKEFAQEEMTKKISEIETKSKSILKEREKDLKDKFSEERMAIEQSHNREIKEVYEKCNKETERVANEIQKESEKAMNDQVKELEQEHRRQLESIEDTLASTRNELDGVKSKLSVANTEIEQYELDIDDIRQASDEVQKQASFKLLQLTASSMMHQEQAKKELRRKDYDASNAIQLIKQDLKAEKEELELRNQQSEEVVEYHKEREKRMYNILVNHKREVLLQQKRETVAMSRTLQTIRSEKEALERQREQIQCQLKKMEDGIRELERQMQLHSSISSAVNKDGRINLNHARKKRRMDEEYEQLLENIEVKREKISKVDSDINDVRKKKEEADEKMKVLERTLVEVLVEQQKNLLVILQQER